MKNENLTIEEILRPIPEDRLHELTREELLILIKGEQKIRHFFQEKASQQEKLNKELQDEVILIEGKYVRVKKKLFGKSSEKSSYPHRPKKDKNSINGLEKDERKESPKLPSTRYPNVPIVEHQLELEQLPDCRSCGHQMDDSGMTEDSEYITVIPKQYLIIRQKRHKYRCSFCHGDIQTTPSLPRITPGSSYSDELIIDVALSKYCDLIPIERYAQMSGRQGGIFLPPHSLIETTHKLAEFTVPAYQKLKLELENLKVIQADETPHRMLEGDKKNQWYLWGFSGAKTCYFECHDTRAGAVAFELLKKTNCLYLLSDVFSGYSKAIGLINEWREENNLPLIQSAYCNAHSRRKFKDAEQQSNQDTHYFINCYRKIYRLEGQLNNPKFPLKFESIRKWQRVYFRLMERKAKIMEQSYSSKSAMTGACNYFLNNYEGLTLFLNHNDIPIDNNAQERSLRNPVIGRKTWHGTHSKKGAQTSAQLFSLVESCKLNKLNPRNYFQQLIKDLQRGKEAYTPKEYSERFLSS